MSEACALAQAARDAPDAPALVLGDEALDYRGLDRLVGDRAATLRQDGLCAGAAVAVVHPTGLEALLWLLASLRIGAVACPLNLRLPAPLLAQMLGTLPLQRVLGPLPASMTTPACAARFGLESATAVFTSGSSAQPKAAVIGVAQHLASAARAAAALDFGPGDRWLLSLPLYHVSGLGIVFRALAARAAIALPMHRAALAEALVSQRPTHVSLVPTQLYRLLRDHAAREALRAAKCVLLGGAPAAPPLFDEAFAAGLRVVTCYGMTETATLVTATRLDDGPAQWRSAGRPLADDIVRIGAEGEIEVAGPSLFHGYWSGGALTPARAHDGWFRSGDLGRIDPDGYLHVLGRRDRMFLCAGENVQPEAVEAVLRAVPGVEEVAVVPVHDAEFGERALAFWSGTADAEALDAAAQALPWYARPVAYRPMPPPPEGALKPARAVLLGAAAEFAAGR